MFLFGKQKNTVSITSVKLPVADIHDVDSLEYPAGRTLRHMTRASHSNYAPLHGNELEHYNELALLLVAQFIQGQDADGLVKIYEEGCGDLGDWPEPPFEVISLDWRSWYGRKELIRSWVALVEDDIVNRCGTSTWLQIVSEYLIEGGDKALIHGLIGRGGYPLIYLGNAMQIQSKEMAADAIAIAASEYSPLSKYITEPKYTFPGSHPSTKIADILKQVRDDSRMDKYSSGQSYDETFGELFQADEAALLEHWNNLVLADIQAQFIEGYEIVMRMFSTSRQSGTWNRPFAMALAATHSVNVLFHFLPESEHVALFRQWWLLILSVYVANGRPTIVTIASGAYEKTWDDVPELARQSPGAHDALFMLSVKALQQLRHLTGDPTGEILNVVLHFILGSDFKGW